MIGEVAKKFSISRSTLLYYDSIGLLTPSRRNEANYRLYSDNDISKMEKISLLREAGLPLESIACAIELENSEVYSILEKHLFRVNKKIQQLRSQQKVIIRLLKNEDIIKHSRIINKEHWISLLKATGLDENDMKKWHIEFEKMSPEAHQDFLESLGIQEHEIKSIRKLSSSSDWQGTRTK